MFGRGTKKSDVVADEHIGEQYGESGPNPWVLGREKWNDRYSNMAKEKHSWKAGFFVMAGLLGAAVISLGVVSSQSKIQPYLAVVDKTSYQVHVVGPVAATPTNDKVMKKIVEREVRDFITGLRSVIGDRVAQKAIMKTVYSRVASGSSASRLVGEWFRERNPLLVAETSSFSVDIDTPLPLSDKSFQVEWWETERAVNGEVMGKVRWKAVVTYEVNPPAAKSEFNSNPIGWYATGLEWAKQPG